MSHNETSILGTFTAPASGREREELVRRWLKLVIRRSTLDELSERPLGERIRELDLLLEAVEGGLPEPQARRAGLAEEIERRLSAHESAGETFTVAILAGGAGWPRALSEVAVEGETVLAAGDGATAVLLSGVTGADAREEADRLRVSAWRRLGGEGRLADVGLASCPGDGTSAHELLAAAHERLRRATDVERDVPRGGAAVTALHPVSS